MAQTLTTKPQIRRRSPFGLGQWLPNQLLDLDRMFDSMFDMSGEFIPDPFHTRMDVSETDQAVTVKMDLPGVAAKDIDISVENNLLIIRGERREEKEETDNAKQFHRIERRFGSFSRSLPLPCAVNEGEAAAEFKEGVLTVTLPKTESAKPRKISVK
jgi:HSP20 family protein